MALFESLLTLLFVSILLLKVSGHIGAPYPTMLAFAGACVAGLPWVPEIDMQPRLALALFIAPALLDAAYDLPPRELRRDWLPLTWLALIAVVLTTAAVAVLAWAWEGMPIAAAIALGAIVAPPDAAAAAAVLAKFPLPRRTMAILQGESLLNDATALLIFTAAVAIATLQETSVVDMIPSLLVAAPGGVALGLIFAKLYFLLKQWLGQTLTARVSEFVVTFGTWVVAEHLHVSPILAVVTFAMTAAHYGPERQTARDRVHSYAIWEIVVFVLNVLAFLLMGLQARTILARLDSSRLWQAIWFGAAVLAVVIGVRIVWVMIGTLIPRLFHRRESSHSTTTREAALISWCGMRGLVTLATAFALPSNFPHRDVIVLSAFIVVLGSLMIQGLTVGLLIRIVRLEPDKSLDVEISKARGAMVDAALASLRDRTGDAAVAVRAEYEAMRTVARDRANPQADTEHDRLRVDAICAQRELLATLRRQGKISDDAFHRLEEELDWAELHASPREELELLDA
jgi:monovalent cation:H+ antiporter, CPA1 family